VRAQFDAWLEAAVARVGSELEFREIRKGVQALSSLYVERREGADLAARAIEGRGKRAAIACYYAPLHFLTAHHALERIGAARLGPVRAICDLGCGSGAAGAAAALAFESRPAIEGVDRSGFLLGEARRTWSAYGLSGRAQRGRLPAALPRPTAGALWLLGWSANEMDEGARAAVLAAAADSLAAGASLLVLEPLAAPVSPWWKEWTERLSPRGVEEQIVKLRVALPEWLARLDKASGLDHQVLGARVLAGPFVPGR